MVVNIVGFAIASATAAGAEQQEEEEEEETKRVQVSILADFNLFVEF